MASFQSVVYFLCLGASLLCLVLLIRSYMRTGTTLLLWSALCFVGLALNNLFLIVDVILLPEVYILPFRYLSSLAAVGVLLYGFIWELD
ncbi:MAG TPA: DUF5985 family protein [Alphaproteobacteria bacterium]